MKYLHHWSKFNESFLSEYEDIGDVLAEINDIVEPREITQYQCLDEDGYVRDRMPNRPEYYEITSLIYPIKDLEIDDYIDLLNSYKSLRGRLTHFCQRHNITHKLYHSSGFQIEFKEKKKHTNCINYRNEFEKLIDFDSYYYVVERDSDRLCFDKFEMENDYDNHITHGRRGSYFQLFDFERSISKNDSTRVTNRRIFKIGEEKLLFDYIGNFKLRKNISTEDMIKDIRQKIESYNNTCATPGSTTEEVLGNFDREISKIYK